MDVTDELSRAIDSVEVLLVKYHGGSKPGESRQISPSSFVGTDKVRAYCHASGQSKVFVISKIEVLYDGDHESATYATAPVAGEPDSLTEALAGKLEALRMSGWHVKEQPNSCSIHRHFKNGKPRSTPALYIEFREFVPDDRTEYFFEFGLELGPDGLHVSTNSNVEPTDVDYDDIDYDIPMRKSERPWFVKCEDTGRTSSLKSLNSAVERFIEWAKERSPNIATSK